MNADEVIEVLARVPRADQQDDTSFSFPLVGYDSPKAALCSSCHKATIRPAAPLDGGGAAALALWLNESVWFWGHFVPASGTFCPTPLGHFVPPPWDILSPLSLGSL